MNEARRYIARVPQHLAGKRLDQVLAELFPHYSRTRLKEWILGGQVLVDDRAQRPRDRVSGGERVALLAVPSTAVASRAEDIPLSIVHEDEALIVIDKPAGLVVHPGAGNPNHTLQNALLHHAPGLAELPRAGIVHRLDKQTTGLLIVARTLPAHTFLVRAMQAREIGREYQALVHGALTGGGTVEAALGRHPVQRTRMAVREDGRPAVTHYRLLRRFRAHTLLRVKLDTGRTHQIRVHMAHIGAPIVGDPLYGGRLAMPKAASEALSGALRSFKRQALHAHHLAFAHPLSGEPLQFDSPLPADMQALLETLAADTEQRG